MKNYLLLFLLTTNVVYAQHMYREANDNCYKNNNWYHVTELCDAPGESSDRCDYCGKYFTYGTINAHKKTCKYRSYIKFKYDKGGNREERNTFNYHNGRKIVSYNESNPYDQRLHSILPGLNTVAILFKRDEFEEECSAECVA